MYSDLPHEGSCRPLGSALLLRRGIPGRCASIAGAVPAIGAGQAAAQENGYLLSSLATSDLAAMSPSAKFRNFLAPDFPLWERKIREKRKVSVGRTI